MFRSDVISPLWLSVNLNAFPLQCVPVYFELKKIKDKMKMKYIMLQKLTKISTKQYLYKTKRDDSNCTYQLLLIRIYFPYLGLAKVIQRILILVQNSDTRLKPGQLFKNTSQKSNPDSVCRGGCLVHRVSDILTLKLNHRLRNLSTAVGLARLHCLVNNFGF